MRNVFIFLLMMTGLGAVAQNSDRQAVADYINTYKAIAISEMQRTGVPAAIKLGQGILESGAGRSDLVRRSNNHFGIKCKTSWTGERVYHDDDESQECFRKYPSGNDSYVDHSNFLRQNQRYASLFEIDPENYREWAHGLKKAGYATETRYALALIKCIEEYQLQQYTLVALGKLPGADVAGTAPVANDTMVVQPAVVNAEPVSAPSTVRPAYPEGVFIINGAKVVYAAKGTALLALATTHELALDHLMDFNDLQGNDVLANDQLIFLQRKRKQGEKPYHIVQQGESLYQVAQAEGLRMASLCEYNRLERNQWPAPGERLYLQGNNPNRVQTMMPVTRPAAETIALPAATVEPAMTGGGYMSKAQLDEYRRNASQASEPVATPAAASEEKPRTEMPQGRTKKKLHKVQAKETLYTIARKYKVSVPQIQDWNEMATTHIRAGQELIIYQ